MMVKHRSPTAQCPMDGLLQLLMGPWTTYLLYLLGSNGTLRFGALKRLMPDISAKMLTVRLRHLEAAGLVHRDYKPTVPPQVSYSLTPRGSELKGLLSDMAEIAKRWEREDKARAGAALAADGSVTGLPAAPTALSP